VKDSSVSSTSGQRGEEGENSHVSLPAKSFRTRRSGEGKEGKKRESDSLRLGFLQALKLRRGQNRPGRGEKGGGKKRGESRREAFEIKRFFSLGGPERGRKGRQVKEESTDSLPPMQIGPDCIVKGRWEKKRKNSYFTYLSLLFGPTSGKGRKGKRGCIPLSPAILLTRLTHEREEKGRREERYGSIWPLQQIPSRRA